MATPMMQQYLEVKANYADSIVFFRLGDFYEMFYDDAKLVSHELELTLTGKDCGEAERAPMCGIPYHSADGYIAKLVSRGYKVVICEQTEDPAKAKGLVKREVVRIITPGTVIEGDMLTEGKNNYLCAVAVGQSSFGLCFADISTGDISATSTAIAGTSTPSDAELNSLVNELSVYMPTEIIFSEDVGFSAGIRFADDESEELNDEAPSLTARERNKKNPEENRKYRALKDFSERNHVFFKCTPELFEAVEAEAFVERQFSRTGTELGMDSEEIRAAGALLAYIADTQKSDISHIKTLNIYKNGQFMEIDANTRRNLELCETLRTKEKRGTLLWVLDRTKTSMGARQLRKWVEMPLTNPNAITLRQDAVEELVNDFMLREELMIQLKGMLDLERIITKIVYGTANARDLAAAESTLEPVPELKRLILDANVKSRELTAIYENLDELEDICSLIRRAIDDDPPFTVREGGMIRRGYSAEADRLNEIKNNGKGIIAKIEADERAATGIKNLKVGYNRVFGYYIEVSRSNLGEVPEHYIRKQTLTTGERYITEELKKIEAEILGATDRLVSLEYELFDEVRKTVAAAGSRISRTAAAIAKLDAYLSLADAAVKNSYVRPEVSLRDELIIKEGRHPVVEQFVRDSYFVPNNTELDTKANRLMIITGPNMAGKSTYMRQVALITIMAQIGSFVPAKEAEIGAVDKIFTRVGASDDLASGQSTFMLEMTEVAYILNNATKRSLIIYDEIGRGTSTFDGMSIARAVAEYTAGKKLGAKTLFATHYHELTELEGQMDGAVNYNIAAKKKGDDINFLRRIVRGAADDSYGIEVAKLAGVNSEVIKRAKQVLAELEQRSRAIEAEERREMLNDLDTHELNISFDDMRSDEIVKRIQNIDINSMTPIDALNLVYELKKMAD